MFDACQMTDRCNPSPCKHSGTCKQNSDEFFCDCGSTGYSGAVCQTRKHFDLKKIFSIIDFVFYKYSTKPTIVSCL